MALAAIQQVMQELAGKRVDGRRCRRVIENHQRGTQRTHSLSRAKRTRTFAERIHGPTPDPEMLK